MSRKIIKIDKNIVKSIKSKQISLITQDINKVIKDSIFVCIKGANFNGHTLIKEAFKRGAKYVIGEEDFKLKNYHKVSSSRKALSYLLNLFYNYPDKKLKIIGVVGTNGKTSTTYIFKEFCELLNKKCGVIGTNGNYIGTNYFASKLTTPDSEELFFLLDKMVKNKIEYCIIEVSAHAIKLNKVFSINFFSLCFTNFSQDHLDFFKTMEEYQNTKMQIFKDYNYINLITNTDDKVGNLLHKTYSEKSFSIGKNGKLKIKNYVLNLDSTTIELEYLQKTYLIKTKLLCDYNVYNLTLVIAILLNLGFNIDYLIEVGAEINNLKGRFEVINFSKTHTIIIDYAHTPKSTENTLNMIKQYYKNDFLICLIGAPGNRDISKRKIIGEICDKYADKIILSSDNPHFENPMRILYDLKSGIKNKDKCLICEDRSLAVKNALKMFLTRENSVFVMIGKGIEDYQDINGAKIPYSDKEEIKKLLEN